MSEDKRQQLEQQLNDFAPEVRRAALDELMDLALKGDIKFAEPAREVNVHCHTFYSFNGYGYSPTCYAWKARCAGLAVAGIVDFDVLDGVEEFLEACKLLGQRACAGIETRVFVADMASSVINSPGEPGIAYYMGAGFVSEDVGDAALLARLKDIAAGRTRGMQERIDPHLDPVNLDFEQDVLPLTPAGNATERHLCMAYDAKGKDLFPDDAERAAFWAGRLGLGEADILKAFQDPPVFQGMIRSKLMKSGGVGYVKPEGPDFPKREDVTEFILAEGAIPTVAWLDGTRDGEDPAGKLLDSFCAAGAAAVNIIPDRNWNIKDPETKRVKVGKLNEMIAAAQARDLPIIVGTEMNAYGQRFVDDFSAPEMEALAGPALEGAYIMYAHTMLQQAQGMGYMSEWAGSRFGTAKEKNAFFAKLGRAMEPAAAAGLERLGPEVAPEQILVELS